MTTPSLTPNEDAVRQGLEKTREESAKFEREPGQVGANARMSNAVADALTVALAKEFDRSTDQPIIYLACVATLADCLTSISGSLSSDNQKREILDLGVAAIRRSLNCVDIPGDIEFSAPLVEVARA